MGALDDDDGMADEGTRSRYGARYPAALAFAAHLHRTQVRKGSGIPYITHLVGVSELVWTYGGDEDQAIAGLLHDSIEDQHHPHLKADLLALFGTEVLRIVEACTDAEAPAGGKKPPWPERKQAYLARIAGEDARAALVSCADKLHNARSIVADAEALGAGVFQRFTGGPEGTTWYYRSVADAFRAPLGDHPLRQQLVALVPRIAEAAGVDPATARPVTIR